MRGESEAWRKIESRIGSILEEKVEGGMDDGQDEETGKARSGAEFAGDVTQLIRDIVAMRATAMRYRDCKLKEPAYEVLVRLDCDSMRCYHRRVARLTE